MVLPVGNKCKSFVGYATTQGTRRGAPGRLPKLVARVVAPGARRGAHGILTWCERGTTDPAFETAEQRCPACPGRPRRGPGVEGSRAAGRTPRRRLRPGGTGAARRGELRHARPACGGGSLVRHDTTRQGRGRGGRGVA